MTRVNIDVKITQRLGRCSLAAAAGRTERLVLCDIDDTVWPCTRMVAEKVGVDYAEWTNFRHRDNPTFTDEQKSQIDRAYQDPEHFLRLKFFDGFEKLLGLEEHGARFKFCSNSMAEEVVQAKQRRMSATLPQLRPDQLQLNLIAPATTLTKKMDEDVYILIDDGPYNVQRGGRSSTLYRRHRGILPSGRWR